MPAILSVDRDSLAGGVSTGGGTGSGGSGTGGTGIGATLALQLGDEHARLVGSLAVRLRDEIPLVVVERLLLVTGKPVRLRDVEQQLRARIELVRGLVFVDGARERAGLLIRLGLLEVRLCLVDLAGIGVHELRGDRDERERADQWSLHGSSTVGPVGGGFGVLSVAGGRGRPLGSATSFAVTAPSCFVDSETRASR